ncbi:MAG: hypothetical protein L6Q57_09565, partial [Alphaproteobacteria bacterium]|nr:hypothetical protein [Alphaproteobacteria bacterium]
PSEAADIKEKMRAVIDANPLHFTGMSDTDGATGIFGFCSTEEGKNMIKKIPGVTVSEPIHMMVRATNSRAAPAATAA